MLLNRRSLMLGAAAGLGSIAAKSQFGTAYAQGLGSANALKYEAVDAIPNAGRFHGKLAYSGPPVEPIEMRVTKDSSICGEGVRSVQPLRVAEDGGLADAVVQIRGITRGKPWQPVFDTTKIYQIDCSFQPFVQIGKNTADAEIFNFDPILHNIHAYEVHSGIRRAMFNFSQPKAGQVDFIPLRLRRGHLVTIDCNAHNWMAAWVYTSPSPYIAVTTVEGRFEINDIPPGNYEVVAWHPVLGERTGALTIGPNDDLGFNLVLS
ncbi:carboxypeptidase regulatory-like domain-containing protein [Litoreibacter roseus]|uniref:Rhamnogalacturonan lyase domain-containing protein n=1 Tax=Litoreibacter roseus TaxID=2601869 RepID=A0A6N6JGZ4_9RHOB|nr:carboxypeptidase regulatory-like domain-containing protein [Litoreibacter roseus]GFE65110.1 hypothetical protein KIN_21840 [Litoreibacter roseus]